MTESFEWLFEFQLWGLPVGVSQTESKTESQAESQTSAPDHAKNQADADILSFIESADTQRTGFDLSTYHPVIITIDGPAGTGKSTVARELAIKLGLDFLDTGAMYRAAAAIMIDRNIPEEEIGELVTMVLGADLHFDWSQDPPMILAWNSPIDHRIRNDDVTKMVSFVAAIPELRHHMVRKQRVIGAQHPRLVTEGRDQGSVVFPDAAIKFYLDADPEVRAKRRIDQLGVADTVGLEEMCERIVRRDKIDSGRDDGPLVCPDDAIVIDTAKYDVQGVIDLLEKHTRERIASLINTD